MASQLPGTSLVDPGQESTLRNQNSVAIGYQFVFLNEAKAVIYISSGVDDNAHVSLDISSITHGSTAISGTVLSAVAGTSPSEYNAIAALNHLNTIDLEGAAIDGRLDFTLKPYETIEIVVSYTGDQSISTDPQSAIADSIITGDGNDSISSFGGNDVISSGAGSDQIGSGSGDDTVRTGDGSDTIFYSTGNDSVDGGNGTDTFAFLDDQRGVSAEIFSDTVTVENIGEVRFASIEVFSGSDLSDVFFLRVDDLSLLSGSGNDVVNSFGDSVVVDAGDGDDLIRSLSYNSFLSGGAGEDTMFIFEGGSTIEGGGGNDTIVLGAIDVDILVGMGSGNDTVYGFSCYTDSIQVRGKPTDEVTYAMHIDPVQGSGVEVTGSDWSVFLSGVMSSSNISVEWM